MKGWKDGWEPQTGEEKKGGKPQKRDVEYLHHEVPSLTVTEGCARPRLW